MSQTATAAREPLLRIAKREGTTMPQKIAVRAIAILLALVVDALFIFFVTGLNPLSVYGVMWSGTFANMTRFSWMPTQSSVDRSRSIQLKRVMLAKVPPHMTP